MRIVLSVLLCFVGLSLFSRSVGNDTIPYKVERYEVKKQMKVFELAAKLKVEASIIVKLNKFRSVNSIVVKGQKVKVPVYPKPEKKPAEKKPKESKTEEKKAEREKKEVKKEKSDTVVAKKESKSDKKKRQAKVEETKPAKKKSKQVDKVPEVKKEETKKKEKEPEPAKAEKKKSRKKSEEKKDDTQKATAVTQPLTAKADSSTAEEDPMLKTAEFEKAQVRLIMIDAILDLDEAMMEGAKASLDSLDVQPGTAKSNGTSTNDRFAKEKAKLIPYILHVQDSLSQEITSLKTEKEEIEARIFPPKLYTDTVVNGNDIVIYEVTDYSGRKEEERKVLKVITKVTEKPKPVTTTIDAKGKKQMVLTAKDTTLVYDLAAPSPANKGGARKPSARDTINTASRLAKAKTDTTTAIKIRVPNSKDTVVIKPVTKTSGTVAGVSSRAKSSPVLSSADSVKHIKAQFFLKRAQKAISEKNYKAAQEYLEKSIELYPKYFDACYELAQMYEKKGDHREALKSYQACSRLDSTQPKLFVSIGNAYLSQKQKTDAMHYYNKALMLKPDDIPSLMSRASIFTDWKNYKAAITDYDQVLKTDRLYHYAYKARGQVKLLTKDFASAMDDFTRFLIFEESDPSAYYYRGLAKIGNNDLLEGCMDLSTSAGMGYAAAEKAIKKSCE